MCHTIRQIKKFEIYLSEMAKNGLKLFTMVEENFEIYFFEMAKNGLKLSTMVGENSSFYLLQENFIIYMNENICKTFENRIML